MIDTPPDTELISEQASDQGRFLKLARDAWSASTTYFDASVRTDVEQDMRQWQSRHLRGSKYLAQSYAGRSRLFVPKTRSAITKYEAQAAEAFFSTHDVVSMTPPDKDDPVEVARAAFYKALLQIRLTTPGKVGIPWFLTCIGAYQESHVVGMAIGKTYWSIKHDKPQVDLVAIENFRFDPASDWRDPVGTSPYLIHIMPMYVRDVKDRIAKGRWLPVDESELTKATRQSADTIRSQREGQRTDSQSVEYTTNEFNTVLVHENIADVDGTDMIWYTLLDQTMLSNPEPIVTQYAHGRPFAVGIVNLEANRAYPSSTPRLSRDVQREINELRNQRIDNVSFVLNKRYFVKRNKQVDLDSLRRNVAGSSTLMDDPQEDVRVVETPDVTGSSYQEQDRLNLDFDDVVGAFSQSSVQSNRSLNETVGGLNLISTNANQTSAYKLRTFTETWVEPVLRQLVELERQYENDERIIGLAAAAAGITDPAMMEDLWSGDVNVTVNVGMGATNPQEKANLLLFGFNAIKMLLADGALEQRGLNAREAVKEIFAMLGYRDGSRFFRWGEEDPVVAQLQQTIESLQSQLAAKTPPELLAAQVDKLAAEVKRIDAQRVAEGVRSAYSAVQAGMAIASVPSVAPIADEVMRTAGWQPQPGQDPDFPQPAAPDPAIMQGDVRDRRTGVAFMPPNTNPMLPAPPQTGEAGVQQGIETPEDDAL